MNDEQRAKLRAKFNELLALPDGWDGYGAKRIDPHTADRLMGYCEQWITPSMPLPQVVPLNSGGIQLGWHGKDADIEIELEPNSGLPGSLAWPGVTLTSRATPGCDGAIRDIIEVWGK